MEENQEIKVLLVDDRPENLLALKAVLKSLNYHLITANSGEEAFKQVLNHDFAVILLDVQMPGLNGFETAEMIKSREELSHIPIIFITAINQSLDNVYQGYSVGAVDYIFKPFKPDILRSKVAAFVKIFRYQQKLESQRVLLEKQKDELKEANDKLKETTSELQHTTSELRNSEALTRIIGETSIDSIVTIDPEGSIISANPATEKMFGFPLESLLGQKITKLVPTLFEHEQDNLSLEGFTSKIMEAGAFREGHGYFPVDIQIGKANVEERKFFVCFIRDITERKEMEEKLKEQNNNLEKVVEEQTRELVLVNQDLRQSEERFRKIFESSPNLIAIRSVSTGHYIDVNESWMTITGYTYEEVKNQTRDCLHLAAEFAEKDLFSNEVVDLEKGLRNARISFLSKQGQVREGLLSTEIAEIQGEECVISVITDITERVSLEKKMARLDRLNLIGEMAAGIAHEIRNPMTTVSGFLQIAKSKKEYLSNEYINLMVEELNRANTIITEFLNLAKNKATDKKSQTLNKVIKAIFPLIKTEALLSDKVVTLKLGDCPQIPLDEKEIRQLILNIALNGLEAMECGGGLTIKTYTEYQDVVLEIQDEGKGINKDILDKIGTPFFTTKDKGTGLGLAVCYCIASRHNAEIKINTSEKGTNFYIRFNQAAESVTKASAKLAN